MILPAPKRTDVCEVTNSDHGTCMSIFLRGEYSEEDAMRVFNEYAEITDLDIPGTATVLVETWRSIPCNTGEWSSTYKKSKPGLGAFTVTCIHLEKWQ